MARRRAPNNSGTKFRFGFTGLFVIVLLGLMGKFVYSFVAGPPDFSGPGDGSVQIQVVDGDSIAKIGNNLKAAGVVKSVDAFTAAAAANSDSKKISPGFYNMLAGMRASDAIKRLLDPTSKIVNKVVVPEGKRAVDIYQLISTATGIPLSDFEAIAADPSKLALPNWANGKIEGFLFPATYEFAPGTTALEALQAMVDKFNSVSKEIDLAATASAIGKTPYEILTIASLLEVEGHPRDFDKVARVVYNRLDKPMRLEFDSTVNYGLGQVDVIITSDLLKKDTPYNMYLHDGLPPTPIGNPGVAAIKAAAAPATGDWIYFITTNLKTQETKFTANYKEFLVWKDEFLAYCDANPGECFK